MITKNENIVLRRIHGLHFLIDITANFQDEKCELYEIDTIGAFIWESLNDLHTSQEIALCLKEALTDDISTDVLLSDVNDFIYSLKAQGYITEK